MSMIEALQWLPKFSGQHVLVLGDLCLDEYIIGKAQRLSREAPVPVLEFQERFTVPGAACNPALNVQALGAQAIVAGVVGDDEAGVQLVESLRQAGIDTAGVLVEPGRTTTLKTRVLASHLFPQQVARVDRQQRHPLARSTKAALKAFLVQASGQVGAVLISDYRSGVVDASLVIALLNAGRPERTFVTVDAQGEFPKFKGVALFRCNREEAEAFLHLRLASDTSYARAGSLLQKRLGVATVVITRGAEGMSMVEASGAHYHVPAANPSEVYDVTGAGDTVIALLTLAMAAGAPPLDAAYLANAAAGLVVRKLGNATVTQEELAAAVRAAGAR